MYQESNRKADLSRLLGIAHVIVLRTRWVCSDLMVAIGPLIVCLSHNAEKGLQTRCSFCLPEASGMLALEPKA